MNTAATKPRATLDPVTTKAGRDKLALSIDGVRTCDISVGEPEQLTRAHIIRNAVNCHGPLVRALQKVVFQADTSGDGTETYAEITRELVDECRAALALAGVA